jgi:hypothetical protein
VLLRTVGKASPAWRRPSDELAVPPSTSVLAFNRAGPVRVQIVADLR